MMRHDTQQRVTTPAEGIPGNLLPGRRSFGESASSPNHRHATSLSAATAACLQHCKQTVKLHLGCIHGFGRTTCCRSSSFWPRSRHVCAQAFYFFFCFYLLSFCFTLNKHQLAVTHQLFWSHGPYFVLHSHS